MTIAAPTADWTSGRCRVAAVVDGQEIWFESDDLALAPAMEAFVTAAYVPAALLNRPCVVNAPLCRTFLDNLSRLRPLLADWWACQAATPAAQAVEVAASPIEAVALCFSGGVDSFYSLLRAAPRVDLLVGFIGYDLRLEDTARIESYRAIVRGVAAARGIRAVFVRTNLRAHHLYRQAPWEKTHGGALAVAAHLLRDAAGTLVVSSSHPYTRPTPWGSSWKLDPHFSSQRSRIHHIGAELARREKLLEIADEPLVRQYLRVCWQSHDADLNCCRCEKCVRTMVALACAGKLDGFEPFHGGAGLLQAIRSLEQLHGLRGETYYRALRVLPDAEMKRAIRALLWRSGRRPLWWRIARSIKQGLLRPFAR